MMKARKSLLLVMVPGVVGGSCLCRGFISLFGVVAVASWKTGQVLYYEVLSKFCHECQRKQCSDKYS